MIRKVPQWHGAESMDPVRWVGVAGSNEKEAFSMRLLTENRSKTDSILLISNYLRPYPAQGRPI